MYLLQIFLAIAQCYFLFYTYHIFLSTLAAVIFRLRYRPSVNRDKRSTRFAIMLPAYKANAQFINAIDACLAQDYGKQHFDIFVLAQKCPDDIIDAAIERGCTVFEKTFDHVDGNAYLHALNYLVMEIDKVADGEKYDAIVLVDKDNLLDKSFLSVMNRRFNEGYRAVQGRRRPINLDTRAACFDHIAEATNDQMWRAAKAAIGLSAEISGSGMAFDFGLYKEAISTVDLQSPVHDKTFLLELIKRRVHVFFEPEALLYEEKTASYQAISQQRTRWIGGQFYLCRKNFLPLLRLAKRQHRFEPVDYALTLAKIPRSLHVLGIAGWFCFAAVFAGASLVSARHWFYYGMCYGLCIVLQLLLDSAPWPVFRALFSAPFFILSMMKSTLLSLVRRDKSEFVHTEHVAVISLDDVSTRKTK